MDNDKQDKNLLELVHRELATQADALDPAVCARLRHARVHAIEAGHAASHWQRIHRWWAGHPQHALGASPLWQGFAVAVVTTVALSLWMTQGRPGETTSLVLDSTVQGEESMVGLMDVLMSNEDMDFLENLELYEWLAAEYG